MTHSLKGHTSSFCPFLPIVSLFHCYPSLSEVWGPVPAPPPSCSVKLFPCIGRQEVEEDTDGGNGWDSLDFRFKESVLPSPRFIHS